MEIEKNPEKNLFSTSKTVNRILTILLVFCIVLIVFSAIFVLTNPIKQEDFTEFYLLDSKGQISKYPNDILPGEETTVIFGISNHEHKTIDYIVEIWLINQSESYNETTNKNTTIYENAWFMEKINKELSHIDINTEKTWDPQWEYEYNFNITNKQGKFRLVFLLFKESTENIEKNNDYKDQIENKFNNAYQDLYLWINVE